MQPEISFYILQHNIDFRPRILHPFSEKTHWLYYEAETLT